MPFESEAQRRFMYAKHPELAKEFEKATPKGADLPEHVKKMADGGEVKPDMNEPGIKDATVSDFLLPYLLGPGAKAGAEGALPALESLGETGAVRLGAGEGENLASKAIAQAAPKMEEAAEANAPKITAYVKGIQKGAPGSKDVELWGVKGSPEDLLKEFGDRAPASVPEHILRAKGILPEKVDMTSKIAPNAYAEGGKVERSSLEHPVPNAMMARAMNDGGVWLQNETPETVKKVTHAEGVPHTEKTTTGDGTKEGIAKMAEGGAIHKAEDRNKEPAKPANIEMSHEDKLKSIYKTLGMKKYADGGPVLPDMPTNDPNAVPSQTDPSYWDKIKMALSQVAGPAKAAIAPLEGAANLAAPLAPAAVSAVNTLTGASLPVPPPPAPQNANVGVPAAPIAPAVPPAAPIGAVPPAAKPAAGPDLSNLFNQDTSKLEQGVSAEDRQALVNKLQTQQHGIGNVIAQAVSGLGDALAAKGGREQHSLQGIFSMQKDQRDEALANFDKARQDRLQKLDLQTKMGQNAIAKLAAQDAYGTDENLNKILGAPPGTAHKDLPLYFQAKAAQVAQDEKNADLYMKAHSQAANEIEAAEKGAGIFHFKATPAEKEAAGNRRAEQLINGAKGNVLFQPSDGQKALWIPAKNVPTAQQRDPRGQIIQ